MARTYNLQYKPSRWFAVRNQLTGEAVMHFRAWGIANIEVAHEFTAYFPEAEQVGGLSSLQFEMEGGYAVLDLCKLENGELHFGTVPTYWKYRKGVAA